jgi:hypothetical protein
MEMRAALAPFVTVKAARVDHGKPGSPIDMGVTMRPGAYDVVAFASEGAPSAERENWYVLRRRGGSA